MLLLQFDQLLNSNSHKSERMKYVFRECPWMVSLIRWVILCHYRARLCWSGEFEFRYVNKPAFAASWMQVELQNWVVAWEEMLKMDAYPASQFRVAFLRHCISQERWCLSLVVHTQFYRDKCCPLDHECCALLEVLISKHYFPIMAKDCEGLSWWMGGPWETI